MRNLQISLTTLFLGAAAVGCGASGDLSAPLYFNQGYGYVVHANNAAGAAGGTGAGKEDRVYRSTGVIIDSSSRIVVTGSSKNASGGKELAIWRFTPQGTVDTTFGTNGAVTLLPESTGSCAACTAITNANKDERGYSIAEDSSGRYVVAGLLTVTAAGGGAAVGDYHTVLARFTSTGTLDTTFGPAGTGYFMTSAVGSTTFLAAGAPYIELMLNVSINSSGKILVAGKSRNGAGLNKFGAIQYDANGLAQDSSFNSGGTPGYLATAVSGYSVINRFPVAAVGSDGKIVILENDNLAATWSRWMTGSRSCPNPLHAVGLRSKAVSASAVT